MLTLMDFKKAKDIVAGLKLPYRLGVCGDDQDFDRDWLYYQVSRVYSGPFYISNGVSKVVIVFDNEPFVIKIPFNGMVEYEWVYDEEADDGDYDYDNPIFEEFDGADAPDNSDYCWDEVIRIEKAEEAGYGDLFPDTEFLTEFDGHRFYIQEKVKLVGRTYPTEISEHSREVSESMDPRYQSGTDLWRAVIVELYGEDFWKNFVDWDYFGNMGILTDMHSGNYGYDEEGRPVILDASGFRN